MARACLSGMQMLGARAPDPRGGHFVIEQAWPSPVGDSLARGVRVTGPVWVRGADRVRALRYEVRCWEGGVIADLDWRIGPARRVVTTADATARVLAQVSRVPALTWGRRAPGSPEMWSSNSAIAWVLASAGLPAGEFTPPESGRAPGWRAGMLLAASDLAGDSRIQT